MRNVDSLTRVSLVLAATSTVLGFSDLTLAQNASAAYPLSEYVSQRDGRLDPQSISDNEALWASFQVIATLESTRPGLGVELLQSKGLSRADALALSRHIAASLDDLKTYAGQVRKQACNSNAKGLALSRSGVAKAFQAIDADADSRRDARLAEIDAVVSGAGKEALLAWAGSDIRSRLKISTVDHAKHLALADVDPATEMGKLCAVGTSTSTPAVPVTKSGPGGTTATLVVR